MKSSSAVSHIIHKTYINAPSIMPDRLWWEYLESDFHKRPQGFVLYPWDQIRVSLTAFTDVLVRTWGASLVGFLAMPVGYNPLKLRKSVKDRRIYMLKAESGDPKQFFIDPPKSVRVRQNFPRRTFFRPENGVCTDLSFESPFEPVNPRIREDYCSHKTNMTAYARYWRHNDGPRPTICAFHGFFADPYWLNAGFFALPWFYKLGADVLLFTLPFHGPRAGRFAPFSGYEFFSGGISRLNEAFAQAVFDFRLLLNYLEEEMGVKNAGVTGISLGGYTSALMACVEDRLQFSIPNVPVVSIADLILEWFPMSAVVRALLFARRNTITDLRHIFAVHSPLTYKPVIPTEKLMIIGGAGDRLAPPKHSRLLWDHWGRCRIYWFPGSHLIHMDRGSYLTEIAKFLRDIKFLGGR